MNQYKTIQWTITDECSGLRLDKALATHPEIKTRSRAAKLISKNQVTLNSLPQKASQITVSGEVYQIQIPLEQGTDLKPFDLDIFIHHEDDDLIVVEKPAGLVVHPSAGHQNDTLVNVLVGRNLNLSMGFNEERPGIVHRLDKGTSGLLVVAKNDEAHTHLVEQFKAKTVDRRYWAIVYGRFKNEAGTIESFIKRHPKDRKRFASENIVRGAEPTGKRAVTHYRVLDQNEFGVSLIECRLETGRTHQIRVHMSENHHPILGDDLYGSNRWTKQLKNSEIKSELKNFDRLALHAFELGFTHPKTGKKLYFRSDWPEDLLSLATINGFKNCSDSPISTPE